MKIPKMTKAQLEKLLNEELMETEKPNIFVTKGGLRVFHKSVVMVQGNTIKDWFARTPWQLGCQVLFKYSTAYDQKEAREIIKVSRDLEPAMKAYKMAIADRGQTSNSVDLGKFFG